MIHSEDYQITNYKSGSIKNFKLKSAMLGRFGGNLVTGDAEVRFS